MPDLFPDLSPVPVNKGMMLKELRREIGMRENVYPKLVAGRKMTAGLAQERIRILEAVVELIEGLEI